MKSVDVVLVGMVGMYEVHENIMDMDMSAGAGISGYVRDVMSCWVCVCVSFSCGCGRVK